MLISDSKYESLATARTSRLGSNVLRWPTDVPTDKKQFDMRRTYWSVVHHANYMHGRN